jgi:hypothetical protein
MEIVTDTTEQAQPPDNREKRVRFQETAPGTPASQRPYGLAKLRANVTIASLPVTMQSLAKHYVFEYLKLKSSLARLEKIKLNLANDSFVPRSARINFAIGASPRAQEAYPTEFESLTERVEMAVGVFQATCKDLIKTALDLEMKTLHDDLTSLFCRAAIALATCCAINSPTFDKSYGSLLVNSSFELNSEALLKHAGLLTRVQFFTALHKYTDAPGAVHQLGDLLDADKAFIAPLVHVYTPIIIGLFVHPWDAFVKATDDIQRSLQVQEFAELSLKSAATETTAMDLEEVTAESQSLKDAVATENKKNYKTFQTQIDRLSQKITRSSSKNSARGATATNKNSSQPQSGRRNQQKQQQKTDAQTADAAANASANGFKKKKGSSKNPNKKSKQKRSNK